MLTDKEIPQPKDGFGATQSHRVAQFAELRKIVLSLPREQWDDYLWRACEDLLETLDSAGQKTEER